jgi:hypothetical protein
MSNNEDWKIQVSFKTPGGTLINVRAETPAELKELLVGTDVIALDIIGSEQFTALTPSPFIDWGSQLIKSGLLRAGISVNSTRKSSTTTSAGSNLPSRGEGTQDGSGGKGSVVGLDVSNPEGNTEPVRSSLGLTQEAIYGF